MEFKRTSDGRVFFSNMGDNDYESPSNTNTYHSSEAPLKSPLTGNILNPSSQDRTSMRAMDQAPSQYQILTLLKSLNEKLKLTQIERTTMRQELKAYRHMISSLEKKASESAKAQAELEHKLKASTKPADTVPQNVLNDIKDAKALYQKLENRTERNDRNVAELMEKAEAHKKVSIAMSKKQAELDRLSNQYAQLNGRVEQAEKTVQNMNKALTTYSPQGQDKLLELIKQDREDRARFMHKIERLEKTVLMLADSREDLKKLAAKPGAPVLESTTKDDAPRFTVKNKDIETSADAKSAQWVNALASQVESPWQKLNERKIPQIALGLCLLLGASAFVLNSSIPQNIETYFQNKELSIVADEIEAIYTPPVISSNAAFDDFTSAPLQDQEYDRLESWDISKDISQFMIKPEVTNPNLPTPAQQEQLNALMDTNPPAVGNTLNQIEPDVTPAPKALEMPASGDNSVTRAPDAATSSNISAQGAAPAETNTIDAAQPKTSPQKIGRANPLLPKTFQNLESLAISGDHSAQHDLAALYVIGQNGVPQDYKRAAYWFDKAAQGGIANATYNMGVLYHQGLGVKQNTEQAVAWYKSAADQGHAEAAYNLGIAYIEGLGVEYNPFKATLHFEKAALSGTVEAAYNLGLVYENGLLGSPKPAEALMWYKIAADNNLPEAQTALNTLINSLGISYPELDQIISDVRKNYPAFNQNYSSADENQAQDDATIIDESLRQELLASEKKADLIRMAQERLITLKLYPGPVDGSAGPKTQDAIRSYQRAYDLPVTGDVTAELVEHMQN